MGGGSRYPGWGILAPTQIYTDMTIKTSKTGRTVVKCSEKQFLCVISDQQKNTTTTKIIFPTFWPGIRGGGQDTPWYLGPHPDIYC